MLQSQESYIVLYAYMCAYLCTYVYGLRSKLRTYGDSNGFIRSWAETNNREFKDVVFEDVVFDDDISVAPY